MNPQAQILAKRLEVLGATSPLSFLQQYGPVVTGWLIEILRDNVPPRETVIGWAREALGHILESHEFPIADDFLDAALLQAAETFIGKAYDILADSGPAI